MRLKNYLYGLAIATPLVISAMPGNKIEAISDKLLKKLNSIPDSLYDSVKQEDLLVDEVYVKLARDGWSQDEIRKIMGDYVRKNRKNVRGSYEYGRYAKQWLPTLGYTPGGDSIYQYIDTTYNETAFKSTRALIGQSYDDYYKSEPYTPDDRKAGKRQPGIFRPVLHKPSSGRIHWIHVHPENADSLIVIPDGAGMFRTHNAGQSWECITDRIPVREHRNTATHSAIPVDPDDWNHIFAFMSNGNPVYETLDGGENWRRVEGATHKGFKRGYCFRDAEGTLKFIGAVQNGGKRYWNSRLYISEDTCKTWHEVIVPDSLKDIHPLDPTISGTWFQQVEFDANNRNLIYMPTSRGILYFDDGAKSREENGRKVFNLKKMSFKVFNQDSTELRSDTTVFPFKGESQGFLNVNPNNTDQMWFATGQRSPLQTAVYYSSDKGKNWITLQEPIANIGSGRAFGNESAWGWLGGFGVNYTDPNWVYGCSMSSAISSDGGRTFNEYAWGHRIKALHEDGSYYHASNSRHNADNHCIVSHKSGRVFRGSDGGMLMKDKNINDHQWTNIGSNMGQMLYYGVNTNEFGDQLIFGNTQDIDAQTYRYGRWGHWRGYEGSTSFTNPYSNTCYFAGGNGGGIEDLDFGSWSPGYSKADVCTGLWYLRRSDRGMMSFYRIEDTGRSHTDLAQIIGSRVDHFMLTRDKGHATIFVLCQDKTIRKSIDNGNTFTTILTLREAQSIAADPDNSDILYVATKGQVWLYDLNTLEKTPVGTGLPNVDCSRLHFHEGSGDLYYSSRNNGFFILEKDTPLWRLWMKGYNTTKYNATVINYTTQEMVIADYGRGVFVADLQNPADRYFKNGFTLKEISHIEGRRTIGINTTWSIPLYYYYEWSVNGVKRENPYQYLTDSLVAGDRIRLKLTLRESPDITTHSAEYIVQESANTAFNSKSGKAISSNGEGMIDLGYVDYFFNDFTVELWVNPKSNGVILCNRQKDWEKGAKGWLLFVENGNLRFRYSPANMFSLPTYETGFTQQTDLNAGSLTTNQWHHVAVTHQRTGNIAIFVDGVQKVSGERILPEHTLNNAMNLGLFADGYERVMMEGSADELKVWNHALSLEEVKESMYAVGGKSKSGLVYYNGFNESTLAANTETYSKTAPRIRKRAQIEMTPMSIFISAQKADHATLNGKTSFFSTDANSLTIEAKNGSFMPEVYAYRYSKTQLLDFDSNIDTTYYNVHPNGYQFKIFNNVISENDSVNLEFKIASVISGREYRIYTADLDSDKKYWSELGEMIPDSQTNSLRIDNIKLSTLQNKVLILVMLNPSIETRIEGMSATGRLEVYNNGITEVNVHARLLGGITEPFTSYSLKADHDVLQPVGKLYFTKGKADASVRIDSKHIGPFGESTNTYLRGEDKKMIPFPVEVVNKISPKEAGLSALIERGGMTIGTAGDYAAMHLSNQISMMGWVRIDSATVLSHVRPLLMFRGGGSSTGLHLDNGNIRCHWNEEGWSWGSASILNVTAQQLGQWIHVALVARPDGIDFYLNGTKASIKRDINKTRILSPLMLGQNHGGDTWFSGAFDHVAAWSRSLTQEEVMHFMHNSIPLNDSALVVYATMDYKNEAGQLLEILKGSKIANVGTVTPDHRSPVPFNAVSSFGSTTDAETAPIRINMQGTLPEWTVNEFNAYPYNGMTGVRSTDRPLKKSFYTLAFASKPTFANTDSVEMIFTDAAILAGDQISLAVRALGSEQPFAAYIPSQATIAGKSSFRVAAQTLAGGAELMLFISPDAQARPVTGSISMTGQKEHNILLSEATDKFDIKVKIDSYNPGDIVLVSVKETAYASLEKDSVDMNNVSGEFTVRIDREKIDKHAWNPVTLSLVGAESKPLTIQVALEPKVRLSLKNGSSDTHFTATTPISTLEVEAELVEGVMEDKVELTTTADMNNILNTGNGTLLTDRNIVIDQFEHHTSQYGQKHEGWNLTGNPYLANINLTKHQNLLFDPEKMTKYLYAYNPETRNYETSDMTQYDQTQQIAPFKAYFVQTLTSDASMTITPVAKQKTINRRVFDYYTAIERVALRLQLSSDGEPADRTEIILDEASNNYFVVNEDAPKLRSIDASANQLFSLAEDTEVSVNVLPLETKQVPLTIVVGTPGELDLTIAQQSGFHSGEVILKDLQTGQSWTPEAGSAFTFHAETKGEIKDRFVLEINRSEPTGINEIRSFTVAVEANICTVFNLEEGANIFIYDTQGRIIFNEVCTDDTWQKALYKGTFLVKIVKQQKEYVTKIIVR